MRNKNTFRLTKKQLAEAAAAADKRLRDARCQKQIRELLREEKVVESLHPQIIGIKSYTNHLFKEKYS